jgi:hypothetical protein
MNMSELVNFSWMSQPSAWIGLITLIALEVVLGIDNIVFLTILSGKLPKEDQPRGQKLGNPTPRVTPRDSASSCDEGSPLYDSLYQ